MALPDSRNNPRFDPNSFEGLLDADPVLKAALAQYTQQEYQTQADHDRKVQATRNTLQPGLDNLAQTAIGARKQMLSNLEGRGVLRSGETDTRSADIESSRLHGEGALRTNVANQITDLDAGTQRALADIVSARTNVEASARQRASDRYAQIQAEQQRQAEAARQADLDRQEQARQAQAQRDEDERRWNEQMAAQAGGGGGGGGGGRGGGGGTRPPAAAPRQPTPDDLITGYAAIDPALASYLERTFKGTGTAGQRTNTRGVTAK